MRLLDTYTGRFVEKDARRGGFKYVILSHTWDSEGEQTFKQLKKIQRRYTDEPPAEGDDIVPSLSAIWTDRDLSPKIRDACAVARMGGYRYIWIDSCCIDKTSSSELSEAINSMYLWYKLADACYAFLVDVPTDENPRNSGSSFRQSRWFTRGWTLQELLAPENLMFLSKDWMPLGWKKELANLVNAITNISIDVLRNPDLLHYVGVAPRLSWAARRETTRVEDRAYSLLGIFDINMPTLYGEGEGAFQRLQEEILKRIPDQSIFAWGGVAYYGSMPGSDNLNAGPPPLQFEYESRHRFDLSLSYDLSLLSRSLGSFEGGRSIEAVPLDQLFYHYPSLPAPDYTFTPLGIRTHMPLIPFSALLPHDATQYTFGETQPSEWFLAVLGCKHANHPGHLLARVCYAPWSPSSRVPVLQRGFFGISSMNPAGEHRIITELVALSAEVLARASAQAMVAAVFFRSPSTSGPAGDAARSRVMDNILYNRPHNVINLLLKKTEILGRRGSHLELPAASLAGPATLTKTLRWPDQNHPTTHWLTISRPVSQTTITVQDTIIIKYQHTLEDDGDKLIIDVQITGKLQGHPIIPVTRFWMGRRQWARKERKEMVKLKNRKGSMIEVELSIEFLALNHYMIDAHTEWVHTSGLERDSAMDRLLNNYIVL